VLTDRSHRRLRADRGSTLVLMPAAVLIVIILGAIAADFSHVHNRKRELIAVASSIANDAVTYGIDTGALRNGAGSTVVYNDDRVRDVINTSVSHHVSPDRPITFVSYTVDTTTDTVTVTLAENVDYIFAKAIPGVVDDHHPIRATGTAVAVED
jgi:Flp pilus assembly protein TadG